MMPSREEWIAALVERHGEERQNAFLNATVAICGLGGLGSNIATALTRAGVGKLILIDFDKVDITNLNRQQYKMSQLGRPKTECCLENLRDISPYTEIEIHTVKLTEVNIPELLGEADIICTGMAGFGSANTIQSRKVFGKFYLCGDEKSDVNDGIGLVASRVMVCAAHEAHMVLRLLSGETEV